MNVSKPYALLLAALVTMTVLPACSKPRSNVQEAPSRKANVPNIAFKDWNEADYRLSPTEHRAAMESVNQEFRGILFYHGSENRKRVSLTFDDGPDNYYTPRILRILHDKGVPATFFMVGKQVLRFPDMARRIVSEGHAIGNHSWDHARLTKLSSGQLDHEILTTADEMQKVTGIRPALMRPPYGLAHARELREMYKFGYRVIDWSVDTEDWRGTSAAGILAHVQHELKPGGIILEHCMAGKPGELDGTLQALPQIIDRLHAQGYQFVTVPTLLQP